MNRPALRYIYLLAALLSGSFSGAQVNSDCETAVSVCTGSFDEQNSPTGTGNVFEWAPGTCQTGGEFNSAWYVFSPQSDGVFNFTLQPNDDLDDYDWSLFDITDAGCGGINSGDSPEISCNSYGLFGGTQGPTGISSAEGGSGTSNGPGDLNGPPFNSDVNVTAGSIYALVVMNYSATLNGYTLDFEESTSSIYDDDPPVLLDVIVNCESAQVEYVFSEPVDVASATASDFFLEYDGGVVAASNFSSVNADYDDHILVQFSDILPSGVYTTGLDYASPLDDVCENLWLNTLEFEVLAVAEFEVITEPACNGDDGSVQVEILNADETDFAAFLNDLGSAGFTWSGLAPGTYELEVQNSNGCSTVESVTVDDVNVTLDAGADQVLCDMQTDLQATFSGETFSWITSASLNFTDPGNPLTGVIAAEPGTYEIFASATSGNCVSTDGVSVTFSYPPEIALTTADAICFNSCDGSVGITNGNPGAIVAFLDNSAMTGHEVEFSQLCAGSYELVIEHGPECTSTHQITIGQPDQVIAQFDASAWEVPLTNTEVTLTSHSENADSVLWQVTGHSELFSTDGTWTFSLPQALGFYQVTLIATGENGCTDLVTAQLFVGDEFEFYIPNSFTPDNDGINDVFTPFFTYAPLTYELSIFNRYGEIVFSSEDHLRPWTGNVHNGEFYCPNGVYAWQLKTRGQDVDEKTYTGHVIILR